MFHQKEEIKEKISVKRERSIPIDKAGKEGQNKSPTEPKKYF